MTHTPRLPLLAKEEAVLTGSECRIPEIAAGLNVFRVLLHHPRAADAIAQVILGMMLQGTLPARLRELVILRVAWRTASSYEWGQHAQLAKGCGLEDEDVAAVRDWAAHDGFDAADRCVLDATDELVDTDTLSDATWTECRRHLEGDQELIELLALVGAYRMLAGVLNALEVPLDDGLVAWAPDGVAPTRARGSGTH